MPKSDLIAEEIKWCEEHRNPQAEVYQDGFISGLKHALFLMNSRPTPRAADGDDCEHELDTNETGLFCIRCGECF